MDIAVRSEAWAKLYNDPELGAGNFLFKAFDAYTDTESIFLHLEKPYISPSGASHTSFSLNTLCEVVAQLAAWYVQKDVKQGNYVCLYLGDGIASFLHFLALNSLACVPVLINGNLRPDIAALYADLNRFSVFVHDRETATRWQLDAVFGATRRLDAGFKEGVVVPLADLCKDLWPAPRHADDTIMICHSSGTTGVPKAVLFGHAQFFNGKRERLQSFVEDPSDKLATAMPTTHAAGISYLMTAVLLQLPTLSLNTQTGPMVATLLASFQPTIVTAFPQTYASFAEAGLPDAYFKSIRRFYNTGDSAHEAHIAQLLRLAPDARFTDMFGASELGMSQFFKVSTVGSTTSVRSVGKPAAYAHCAILAPDGKELPDGTPGYFGVHSPTVTPGYYGQPHLTAMTTLNGYWLTSDVGLRMADGEFIHLDRAVDVVDSFIIGKPAYTLLLEEHLLKLRDIFDVTVVGIPRGPTREEALLILVRPNAAANAISAEQILRHTLQCYPFQGMASLPEYCVCIGILEPDFVLPLGSTGKVLKRVIRDNFWAWQREFDEQQRDKLGELLWNQDADLSLLPSLPARSLLEYVMTA
ncbi:class I adenylate-forming enzyme family protein [Solimicrobium silvestre]|uniref:AMP-binding enzyme n=1 Tax=Solimicrobium silvestre TaxID=2099400 RepID=A0A2S9H2V7_9BURK|nr:class I adenylate-forming enzyme family protein [Solimicrobium silvestre]PRC94273.1 AMP-binding enzyme [Solimicrobium silvestre]